MSGFAPETRKNPNKAANSHTSPSRLQNERPHAEQIAKNAWQPKCGQSARARSADTAAPRGTVRGKPAHATGATPGPAPALVRRRPRRTSRRAKRPSPQPCCDVDRGVSVAFDGVEAPCSLQNESRRWRVGGVEVPSRIRAGAGAAALQPPIDRSGRTCATAASPRRRSSLEQQRGPSKGPRSSSSPAGKGRCVDGICRGDGVLVGLKSLETTVAHSAEYLR